MLRSKLRVFEAFAGIGSQRKALQRLGIDHEVIGISEWDKYAYASYEAIHGKTKNYGDITKINTAELPDFDLFTYSFPCTDLSVAGKQKGLIDEDGNLTRSGLLYEALRIIKDKRPKYLLAENVDNLVGKKFIEDFKKLLRTLEGFGYKNYWKILNAKEFGVPQNRKRVFVVSIRNDVNHGYEFPTGFESDIRLKDILEKDADEKYYLSEEHMKKLIINMDDTRIQNKLPKREDIRIIGTTQNHDAMGTNSRHWVHDTEGLVGALSATDYKQPKQILETGLNQAVVEVASTVMLTEQRTEEAKAIRRENMANGRDFSPRRAKELVPREDEISNCITATQSKEHLLLENSKTEYRIRKLTPKECIRLMNFDDEDYDKIKSVGMSDTQIYKQCGNSIVVAVLEHIFKNLFIKEYEEDKPKTVKLKTKNGMEYEQFSLI